jgi:hypothetical protein
MERVKLTCNWCDDETLHKRFSSCYVSKYNYDPNVQFVNSNDFDWLVIINHPNYHINFPKEKTIGVIMEPSWSKHYELRYLLERYCQYILCHKKQESPQYIYYPGLLPYHFDYSEGHGLDFYLNNQYKKNKLCSFIVSYNESDPHPSCLYGKRVAFAKKILQSDLNVDIYGNGWENSGIVDSRIKGTLVNKKDGLIDYKFSIAIENCAEEGYFTEKLTDCILTDTTPIYYGCSNIQNYFSEQYVLTSISHIADLKNILKKSPLKQEKKILATKFNLYTAICKYIKQNEP